MGGAGRGGAERGGREGPLLAAVLGRQRQRQGRKRRRRLSPVECRPACPSLTFCSMRVLPPRPTGEIRSGSWALAAASLHDVLGGTPAQRIWAELSGSDRLERVQ